MAPIGISRFPSASIDTRIGCLPTCSRIHDRQGENMSETILIVGGSSGMGLCLARSLMADGARVVIAGRSVDRLRRAADALADVGDVRTIAADITREDDVIRLFAECGDLDHIVSTAADIEGAYELLPALDVAAARKVVDSKFIGPLLLAKHGAARLAGKGSITFTSGIAAYRPAARGSVVAGVNGALESLAYALAIELAPIRVNVVSPGWVDTPIWKQVAGDEASARLNDMAKRLPVGRIGQAADIADGIRFLMRNGFATGSVLHLDGGHRLV
jgi:NAD(P)-dependent dehydrogenase (short-subunit alcohol dehydrogenase family)